MDHRGRVELLAPAGSPEGFYGALRAGADAIYLGGRRYGARAYAENFTEEELVACIRYARLFGVKVNLTVNTLLKEQELRELPGYLEPFCQAGLDAVIVQDFGVLQVIREHFPELEIHASTQMTLCSRYGAELLRQMGVSRIVPARELSLEELTEIKKQTGIELETFIHGAMCYCYSGQCLFSSLLGGRSGNRGRCAQPCRLPYTVHTKEDDRKGGYVKYPLSLKDMCTIDCLPALIEAGIDSFKIEGRMKRAEYAAGVTAVYRKYIDRYYSLREKLGAKEAACAYRVLEEDKRLLSSLYIRSEVHDGYYRKRNGKEMVTLDSPAYSDTDEALLADIRRKYLEERPALPVQVSASFMTGQPAVVSLARNGAEGRAEGEPVCAARKQPITEEDLKRQLGKLGESPFRAERMNIQVSQDAFYSLRQINELRRAAAQELEKALLAGDKRKRAGCAGGDLPCGGYPGKDAGEELAVEEPAKEPTEEPAEEADWVIFVRTKEQLFSLMEFCEAEAEKSGRRWLRRLYVDAGLLLSHTEEVRRLCDRIGSCCPCRKMAAMPYVIRESDSAFLERLCGLTEKCGFDGYLIRSLDALGFLQKRQAGAKCRADAGVYAWNSTAARRLCALAEGFCMPYELNAREQHALADGLGTCADRDVMEKVFYGRLPMMVTANCVLKTTDRCRMQRKGGTGAGSTKDFDGEGESVWLTDRYRKDFPVLVDCSHCTNIIYNSVPLALPAEVGKWRGKLAMRLDFTLESGQELKAILNTFLHGAELPPGEYTTGHEKRGAE